ncbi:family 43 glycosylhydrolase [Promicromonospora panici]|uniref:family 43 glycosylhydrolase n=1 Tax=Promicromonospora panici TaxID=2219658 RepID=UPI00101B7639|nr:family 43 glycosylhydrolase [Promicromonospora panici]
MEIRFVAVLASLALVLGASALPDGGSAPRAAAAPPPPGSAPPDPGATPSGTTFTNPITEPFADTYADPAVIRGKDGWWYLYATSDPLVSGGPFGNMHVSRSRDLESWEYVGTIFDEENRPSWAASASYFWAPDIRYVDGQYVMYYTVTDTEANPDPWDYTIGVATAPTPTGPWTDSGGPVLQPRPASGDGYLNTIDPALFADEDGSRYLYFGGFNGGIWVTELDETGTRAVGEPTRVTVADRYEGAFVVKRDGWYYLMGSSANCCSGPVTGYSVYTGRSRSPLGPFVDHEGVSLNESRVGGTQVVAQNGNRWIGVGHHAVLTDASGQDWMFYHAIDKDDAWLNEPGGVNRRPTLIDRMDWIDGWPVVNAGAGPSEGPQPGPVSASGLGIVSGDPASGSGLRRVSGTLARGTDGSGDAGAIARLVPSRRDAAIARTAPAPREVRLEADVRLPDAGGSFAVTLGGPGSSTVSVRLDAKARELVVGQGRQQRRTALPANADLTTWHVLTVEARDGAVAARLSSSGLGDVDAEARLEPRVPLPWQAPVSLVADGGEAQLDNLTVVPAHEPVTRRVAEPRAGAVTFAEEFDGELDPGWRWLHGPANVEVADGGLSWPLTNHDLVGAANDAPALLRDAPDGDFVLEATVTLPLGENTVRNYQQAGLLVHAGDDDFLRLAPVSIWQTRQVEFSKELTADGRTWFGGHVSGPVADTMHLRLFYTTDPATGEHRYRAATSRDGRSWRFGATWALPAGTDPSVGIYAGGGATPATTATFEGVRLRKVG